MNKKRQVQIKTTIEKLRYNASKWFVFIILPVIALALLNSCSRKNDEATDQPGVAVLLVDTDHGMGNINMDKNMPGHLRLSQE